jgi:hypothetical protein
MAMPVETVELGFDENQPGNWFVLDNPVRGVLDNTTYVLSAAGFYDVTAFADHITLTRGKSRELDRFNAGHLTVGFNNVNRYFDPTWTSSPFYGQIVPRRAIRYKVDGKVQFTGEVDDWNLSYQPDGNSDAEVSGYDAFSSLSKQALTGGTATSQLSGARINAVLDDSGVNWGYSGRKIDAGQEVLQADVIPARQDVLGYINTIEATEPGIFFIGKDGSANFRDRSTNTAAGYSLTLADDGTGIKYSAVTVIYGSELLYNQSQLTRLNGGTATGNDTASQATYGIRTYSATGLLHNSDLAMGTLAAYLVNQYNQPEYRFDAVEVIVSDLNTVDRGKVLDLEIGSICKIIFTPNNTPPAILKYGRVIGLSHNVTLSEHRMTINFQTLDTASLVLDDTVFGLLDYNKLGY